MKVKSIEITNIMAIERLTTEIGYLVIVSGRNGVGKTSVLEAIRALLSGGHDPAIIRKGAESGEVTMTLADGVTIQLIVTPSRSTRIVRHPTMGKVSKPQEYIDRLIDGLSVDPVAFLTAKPKDRLATLLEAMPLRITADQIGFLPVDVVKNLDLEQHALEVLGRAHQALYDERTGVNRLQKDKAATARQMQESLPENPPEGDWKTAYESAQKEESQLRLKALRLVEATKEECLEAKAGIERALQEAIQEATAKLRQEADAAKLKTEQDRDQRLKGLQAEHGPRLNELAARMTEAQTMLAQSEKAEGARKMVRSLEAEGGELEKHSKRLSEALDKLTALKSSLLEKTPIRGVEIREGDISVEGVPFAKVNEARRIQIALEVARLRAGELPLVLVDDAEHFDSINMEKFRNAAAKAGLQIVAAKVCDSDLTVEAEGLSHAEA
jgi:DNA repair exonuclease SbcCD ATPase subunit